LLLDGDPKILLDPFARSFAGYNSDMDLLRAIEAFPAVEFSRVRTAFALRNRYAEDQLTEAIARGVKQYVILGAGLDSFAYRCPDLLDSIEVFEVDHPASQEWKRARVAELGIAPPARLHYVPIDFEHNALSQGLSSGGVDLTSPTFFSWLGVTQYLSKEAVSQSLQSIAAISAPGSKLVIQFVVPPKTLDAEEASLVRLLAERSAAVGEPWLSFFEPDEMSSLLRRAGFGTADPFSPAQATEYYLRDRSDGLRLPAYFHMVMARVD
jgi:methyltransferase (TIGR00027 family)